MRPTTPKFPGRYLINVRLKKAGKSLKWLHEQLRLNGVDVKYNHLSSYVNDRKDGAKGDLVCETADKILKAEEER